MWSPVPRCRLCLMLASTALCCVAMISGGCEAEPITPTQKNINTFALAQQKVAEARTRVGDTLATLAEFCARPGHGTYAAFVNNVRAAQSTRYALRDISAVMTDQGNAFFADWDFEIAAMTNEDLKKRIAARKAFAEQAFREIDVQSPDVRAAYDRFAAGLNNLQTFFDYDKSAAAIEAAAPLIATTRADGAELQRQLDLESAALQHLKSVFIGMGRG